MTNEERAAELQSALGAALEWIDAIPAELADKLSTMPGFDRDWADSLLHKNLNRSR